MSAVLQMMGMMQGFNPLSISPTLFINPYVDPYVTTVDNNGVRQRGNIIDSATASTGQALATAGTLGSKPIYNGEGWYFEAGAQLSLNTTTDYNFIHDGSDFDIWVTFFICPTNSTTYFRNIMQNNSTSNTGRGIQMSINSTAGNNQLTVRVGNGTSAFISFTINSVLVANATNTVRLTRSGATARVFINGVLQGTQNIVLTPGVGGSFDFMRICGTAVASANLYLKDLVIFNRALTTAEATSMNTRRFASITPIPVNVYLIVGDSNCAGRALNSNIAGDLTGTIPNAFITTFNTSYDASSYADRLVLGKNQTMPTENPSSLHSSEMRFAKNMGANADVYLIKYALGSNSAFRRNDGAFADFNVSTLNSSYARLINSVIPQALNDLVHSQRKSPVFRGLTFKLAGNDASFAAQGSTWVRVGTTCTVTATAHNMLTQFTPGFYDSSDATAIPPGDYQITRIDANTFTIQVPDAGATSGTVSWSGAYNLKQNSYTTINAIIDYLQNTVKNQVTNGTGYTVNKLRISLARLTDPTAALNPASVALARTAQQEIGDNYLTDNPSRSVNVRGIMWQNTDGFGMIDSLHYNSAGQDSIGTNEATYFLPFINE